MGQRLSTPPPDTVRRVGYRYSVRIDAGDDNSELALRLRNDLDANQYLLQMAHMFAEGLRAALDMKLRKLPHKYHPSPNYTPEITSIDTDLAIHNYTLYNLQSLVFEVLFRGNGDIDETLSRTDRLFPASLVARLRTIRTATANRGEQGLSEYILSTHNPVELQYDIDGHPRDEIEVSGAEADLLSVEFLMSDGRVLTLQ